MKRKDFIRNASMGMGALFLPKSMLYANQVDAAALLDTRFDIPQKKRMADIALNAARSKGATYTDVRIGRYLNQFVITREDKVENVVNTESYGIGIRVIANGSWGFAATDNLDTDSIAKTAALAVAIAKENARLLTEPVQLAPQKGQGEVSWKTPIEKNAFEVPIKEKVDLLLSVNDAAMKGGANYMNSLLFLVNEQKYFASSDGSYIDQDIHRIWPTFSITKIDATSGKFETRSALSSPMGMGYEYLNPSAGETIKGLTGNLYRNRYDMLQDAKDGAKQVQEKMIAKSVDAGKYDLVIDPTNLFLTIHESSGHPSELDRVLGYEANYAGTSFLTLDKWKAGNFNYGSKLVNIVADKLQPHSLGAVGFDDEGVETQEWDIIKDGVLVNYQATRDQAHILGLKQSQGCCYADNWSSVQFQRMPNISLKPGKETMSPADIVKNVEKGIYIVGESSYSIDQQRYNFQFSGQLFYEIKNGKIGPMLKDVAYQSNTQEFWNSVTAIADKRDYRLGGSFFDGKGQPGQVSAVSHGASTTRFNGINVINTARKNLIMAILNKAQAEQLLKKVLAFSKADECEINLSGSEGGNIRYARNAVSTSGGVSRSSLVVSSAYGKKLGVATINEFDDASLEKVVRRSEELAKLAPENPEFMSFLGPQQYKESATYVPATAAIDPKLRADAVATSLKIAKENKLVAAGFMENSAGFSAMMNSHGLFAYNTTTGVDFNVTLRTEDGKGSGYASKSYNDVSKLNVENLTKVAAYKAAGSATAKALEPGKYTVILEPAASVVLLENLFFAMDARQADEGRSFLSKPGGKTKLGEKLVDDKVTIYSDPQHPEMPTSTWSGDGRPQERMSWIKKGVVDNLYYSRYWANKKNAKPIPSPDGIIMEGTEASLEDLIKGTEKGILVTRLWYIRSVDPQTLLLTGLTRDGTFYIENGKIKHPVKNFRFNESPVIMLNNLDALGKPERCVSGESGLSALIPPMRIRDFTFSSLSDAV